MSKRSKSVVEFMKDLKGVIPSWWFTEHIEGGDQKSQHFVMGEYTEDGIHSKFFNEICTIGGFVEEDIGIYAAIPNDNNKLMYYLDNEMRLKSAIHVEDWGIINPKAQWIYLVLEAGMIFVDTSKCRKQIKTLLDNDPTFPVILYGQKFTEERFYRMESEPMLERPTLKALIPGKTSTVAIDDAGQIYILHGKPADSVFKNVSVDVHYGPIRRIACGAQ